MPRLCCLGALEQLLEDLSVIGLFLIPCAALFLSRSPIWLQPGPEIGLSWLWQQQLWKYLESSLLIQPFLLLALNRAFSILGIAAHAKGYCASLLTPAEPSQSERLCT